MSGHTDNASSTPQQLSRQAGLSCRLPRSGQLQQVVHDADQAPLALHLRESSQQELAEPSPLFDLTEHWLGQCLAQSVATAPPRSRQLGSHRRHASACRYATPPGSARIAVALASRGDVTVNVMASQNGEVALGAVARIGREL